jgi:uracil-DNA glycosylase family 4
VSAAAERRLTELANEIRAHKGAHCGYEVCETCTQLVPGEGPANASIVIVGEAPGAKEDAAGVPFVGAAGKFLDSLLAEAGVARDRVFITNVVKARPPKNRDPKAAEVAHHWPWLEAQLDIIKPQLLVPLGRHALARFAPDAKIAEAHGQVLEADGRRLFPLYHPAAALYNGGLRETLMEDAQALGRALAKG